MRRFGCERQLLPMDRDRLPLAQLSAWTASHGLDGGGLRRHVALVQLLASASAVPTPAGMRALSCCQRLPTATVTCRSKRAAGSCELSVHPRFEMCCDLATAPEAVYTELAISLFAYRTRSNVSVPGAAPPPLRSPRAACLAVAACERVACQRRSPCDPSTDQESLRNDL